MNAPELIHLTLRAPIEYVEAPLVPFAGFFPAGDPAAGTHAADEAQEFLFCFELDREQAARIDPDPAAFPGGLVFAGRRGGGREVAGAGRFPRVSTRSCRSAGSLGGRSASPWRLSSRRMACGSGYGWGIFCTYAICLRMEARLRSFSGLCFKTMRLIGVDAPEISEPSVKQCQ